MKILFTLSPLASHLRAMLPTIRAAARAGHDVVVGTGPDLIDDLQRRGYQTWAAGPSAREAWAELNVAPPPSSVTEQLTASASALFGRPGVARARVMLPLASRWAPDLVVHDPTEVAGAEVAALIGAEQVVHGIGVQGYRQFPMLPLVTAEFARSLGTADRFAEITSAPYLDPTVPTLRPHPVGLFFPDVRPFRPELEATRPGARLPLRVQRFSQDRTVLITLGAGPELLSTVLGALREVPVNVLIETGAYEVGALGSLPQNVAAARELPPALALPLCSAMISHGGTAITTAALAYGLPQVILPRGADQRGNAALLVREGVAIGVSRENVQPGAVRRALADVLALPAYPAAAQRLRDAFLSMPTAAEALHTLTSRVTV
jgi:UDP:flavonoid glycosyltransferase YjiC (YdhE family)